MAIFVHMASVWVPFTSESKEAIADYDEIRKEIKLALQECGRRLGVFLRRREHAKSEFRRRNIFELYIEEVVEACNRLKGGKLPKEKLKQQLQKIALKRTGGEKVDELLGKKKSPEGLPDSIIVTAEGIEGDAPELAGCARTEAAPAEEAAQSPEQEALIDVELSKAPKAVKGKAETKKAPKAKASDKKNPAKVEAAKQMSLGFDKAGGKKKKK
jgi:DNA topoisomerase-6 subunit B